MLSDKADPNVHLQLRLLKIATTEDGPMWFGLPERWLETPRWRCCNNHVSRTCLKSDAMGYNTCLACYCPVFLTFPEDKPGPLQR